MITAAPLRAVDAAQAEHAGTGPGWRVRAHKLVTAADPYLAGHFPGVTIYPGVFVIESLFQAVRDALDGRLTGPAGAHLELAEVVSARFLAPLTPGQTLHLDATVAAAGADALSVRARVTRDGGVRVADVRLRLRRTGGGRPGAGEAPDA